jgi:hypothetical protein
LDFFGRIRRKKIGLLNDGIIFPSMGTAVEKEKLNQNYKKKSLNLSGGKRDSATIYLCQIILSDIIGLQTNKF